MESELITMAVTVVERVGFPIVAFLLMYRLVVKTLNKNTIAFDRLSDAIDRNGVKRNVK